MGKEIIIELWLIFIFTLTFSGGKIQGRDCVDKRLLLLIRNKKCEKNMNFDHPSKIKVFKDTTAQS